jgi:signal transduction histidine kinase
MGRRLFWRIYLTLLASLVALTVLGGALWRTLGEPPPRPGREFAARLLSASLPPADAERAVQEDAVRRIANMAGGDLALHAADGALIVATDPALPDPKALQDRPFFGRAPHRGWLIALPDGRQAVARLHGPPREPLFGIAGILGIAAASVALAAFPVARRLTRRLETLKGGVEAWGAGDLARRVPVLGRDEVAALARSFNHAAARIETLVGAHKSLLAGASHELRSPLARLRVGIEMFKTAPGPALAAELDRNLAELDALVDEVLLASRLDHQPGAAARERVELLALAAE